VELGRKAYWEQFEHAPEFVVLFVPGENFFSAALMADPALIEKGVQEKVILATPTTLISLLKAVSYGWRQEALAENARQISELGRELYGRLSTMGGHFKRLGSTLRSATESYNKTLSSLESRVLVTARRFNDLQVAEKKEQVEIEPVDISVRTLQAPEITSAPPDAES
jgi:DNA recombination protein RmuC